MAVTAVKLPTGDALAGSQFLITTSGNTDYLDKQAIVFGQVAEGFDVLDKINDAYVDSQGRPLQDIIIKHTLLLDDPFPDPKGLQVPDASPPPSLAILQSVRVAPDEIVEERDPEQVEREQRQREAASHALALEMIGDLPFAEIKPPENVLFVCKLNPITGDEDLALIFGRFGKINSCQVIRDKVTGDSLSYAFIEFDDRQAAEIAYFKMDNVLIDDRRIKVDFSQSVSKLHKDWVIARKRQAGAGYGGFAHLERRTQYRDPNAQTIHEASRGSHQLVFDHGKKASGSKSTRLK